jgi:hypothetical protein
MIAVTKLCSVTRSAVWTMVRRLPNSHVTLATAGANVAGESEILHVR